MSHLENKSSHNIKAAKLLMDKSDFHCSSVHCSYYSCVQLSKHILYRIGFKKEADNSRQKFHNYFKDTIFGYLRDKNQRFDAVDFRNFVQELNTLRAEADYQDVEIDKPKADEAHKKAEKVIKILNKINS